MKSVSLYHFMGKEFKFTKYAKFTPTEKDVKLLMDTVDAYNWKILQEIPEGYRSPFTSPDITKYLTRETFNQDIRRMKAFIEAPVKLITTKGGVKTTEAELRQLKRDIGVVNRRKQAKFKKYNINTSTGTMGSVMANQLRPIKVNVEQVKPRSWENLVNSMARQTTVDYDIRRAEQYKENFLKGIKSIFTPGLADELIERISKIDAVTLTELYYVEGAAFDLSYLYSLAEQVSKYNELSAALEKYGY